MSPFMIIGDRIRRALKIPSLKLKVNADNCIDCKRCDKACQMSLKVNELIHEGDIKDSECILCGECVDACPKNVIRYSFS